MPLVHNNNLGVYAGVSKQAIDLRLPSHCEEMINCYPTISNGIRRRNPTQLISNNILVEDDQYFHEYDRGLSGDQSEQYLVTIDRTNKLRVFDIVSNEYKEVTYTGNAKRYIESSMYKSGFVSMTVKDTTFIANREVIPRRKGDILASMNYADITMATAGYSLDVITSYLGYPQNKTIGNLAPARVKIYTSSTGGYKTISSIGAKVTVTVNGKVIVYNVNVKSDGLNIIPESMYSFRTNLSRLMSNKLGPDYSVYVGLNGEIYVYNLKGITIAISHSISFPATLTQTPPSLSILTAYGFSLTSNTTYGTNPFTVSYGVSDKYISYGSNYDKTGFVWIKQISSDFTFPYYFHITLKTDTGITLSVSSNAPTGTNIVAGDLASKINGISGFTSSSSGSVLKISRPDNLNYIITISDTFGNQASESFKGTVQTMNDLPKEFPFKDTIVKVTGLDATDGAAYWVKYDGNSWVEHRDPSILYSIDGDTMPHKLVRNEDFTFTLSKLDWDDIKVGDENTQTIPEFIGSEIKDMFFVGGRFGILTKNGISLSQQGNITNFFRTTIINLLDDSAISTYIDSSKSVGLEYASELQGSIVLFGDKLQFILDTSKAITPATISVQPISGFEINVNVKPISVGDSIFFIVQKTGYSSLMEMNKTSISMNIRANDVSAHVPNYIDKDIVQLVASNRDNTVFMLGRELTDTIYVYKHYGTEAEKSQMSWSKWVFGSDIKSIFSFNKELYLFGSRYNATIPIELYPLVTIWNDIKTWDDTAYWVDTTIAKFKSFEKLDIEPYEVTANFSDLGIVQYVSEFELSRWSLAQASGQKELRGNLLVKTLGLSSSYGSNFSLLIHDIERNTNRSIPAIYTVDRNPYISGNSNNMRITIQSVLNDGFQINSISLEGQYNVRSKRV